MTPDFYGLPERIQTLTATVSQPLSLEHLPLSIELAWYLRQRDSRAAVTWADRAESLLSTSGQEQAWPRLAGRLALIRGETARLFGRFDEAGYYMAHAEGLFRRAHDDCGRGDALVLQAGIAGDQGQLKEQQSLLSLATACYRSAEDPLRLAFTDAASGLAGTFGIPYHCPEEAAGAQKFAQDDMLGSQNQPAHPALVGAALARQAYTAFSAGRATAAALLAGRAYPLCYQGGRWRLAVAMASLAAVGYATDYDGIQATEWLERSLALAHQTQWPWTLAVSAVRAAWVLHRLTLPDAAADLLQDCQPALTLLHQSRITALARCAEGEGLLAAGDPKSAEEKFALAEQWARGRDDAHVLHTALLGQARAQASQKRPAAALALAEHALSLAQTIDAPAALAESLNVVIADPLIAPTAPAYRRRQWLERALALAEASHQDLTLPPRLLSALAQHCAAQQDMTAAYHWEHQASIVRDRLEAGRTQGHAATLHSRRRAMAAQKEIDALRHQATMESARADALSGMVHTLERLSFVGQDIMANLDRAGIAATLSRRGVTVLGGDAHFSLILLDPQTDHLVRLGETAPEQAVVRLGSPHPWAEVIASRFERVLEGATGPMLAPLMQGERCLGLIEVHSDLAFDDHRRAIVRSLAIFTANALVNAAQAEALAEANIRLERIANYDGLTNIPNRRFFYLSATRSLKTAQHHRRAFSMILLDIDFFKKVNDTYGHAAGDSVLKDVTAHLSAALKPGEVIGRLGGEEFAVFLPETDQDQALTRAEDLRRVVEEVAVNHPPHCLRVTISLGVSQATANDGTIDSILQRADEALYVAKKEGRNQVRGAKVPAL